MSNYEIGSLVLVKSEKRYSIKREFTYTLAKISDIKNSNASYSDTQTLAVINAAPMWRPVTCGGFNIGLADFPIVENTGQAIRLVAKDIGEYQASAFDEIGNAESLFSLLDSASGCEIINPFTSCCGRFEFSYSEALAEYGAEFLLDWISGALAFYAAP